MSTTEPNKLVAIDTATHVVSTPIVFDAGDSWQMVMSRDGKTLYVALGLGLNGVAAIDTATFTVVNTIEIDGEYTYGRDFPRRHDPLRGDRDPASHADRYCHRRCRHPDRHQPASIVALGACSNGNAYLAPGGPSSPTRRAARMHAARCDRVGRPGVHRRHCGFAGPPLRASCRSPLRRGRHFDTRGNNASFGPDHRAWQPYQDRRRHADAVGSSTYSGPTLSIRHLAGGHRDAFSPDSAFSSRPAPPSTSTSTRRSARSPAPAMSRSVRDAATGKTIRHDLLRRHFGRAASPRRHRHADAEW